MKLQFGENECDWPQLCYKIFINGGPITIMIFITNVMYEFSKILRNYHEVYFENSKCNSRLQGQCGILDKDFTLIDRGTNSEIFLVYTVWLWCEYISKECYGYNRQFSGRVSTFTFVPYIILGYNWFSIL